MIGSSAIRFGTNRGTHWTVAGAVVAIILGSYLIYSNHVSSPTPARDEAAGTPATASGSSTLKK